MKVPVASRDMPTGYLDVGQCGRSTTAKIRLEAVDGVQVALMHVAPSTEPICAKGPSETGS